MRTESMWRMDCSQLALDADDASLAFEHAFVRSLGLPAALADFGASAIETHEIRFLAEQAMTAPRHIRNYRRALVVQDLERAIERVEDMGYGMFPRLS
jgi:glycerol dehydrogenase-like iron-containing ADH family enzyme